jgi:hypothetical protein
MKTAIVADCLQQDLSILNYIGKFGLSGDSRGPCLYRIFDPALKYLHLRLVVDDAEDIVFRINLEFMENNRLP